MLAQLAGTAYELGSVFRDAFKAIVDIKSSGLSVEEYVDQATLGIGGQEDPETKALVGVLMGIQSAKEADEVFKFYAESAQKALKDLAVGGGLWGGAEIPGRPQVLSVAARKARDARQARAEDAARRKKQKEEEDGKATGQGGRTEQGEGAGKGGGAPEGQGDAEGDGAGGGSGDAEGKTEGGGAPDGQGDADGDGDGGDGEGAGGKKKAGRGPRIKKPKAPKTTEGTGKGPKTTEGTTPPPTTPPTTPPPSESFLSAEEEAAIDAEFAKLRATYSGADPEIIVIGIRIANIYIKAGVRSFARYAGHVKSKAPDLWERLKPHLASFWNSAIVGVDDAEEVTPSQARAIIAASNAAADHAASASRQAQDRARPVRRGRHGQWLQRVPGGHALRQLPQRRDRPAEPGHGAV
jgi:ribosomal protein L12E/L44/L45/RPP1/RPP2